MTSHVSMYGSRTWRVLRNAVAFALLFAGLASAAPAQRPRAASVAGRVTESATGRPMEGVAVLLEGTRFGALSDSLGNFRIIDAPAGQQVLRAQRLGYAPTRLNIVVPNSGTLSTNVPMSRHALNLKGMQVTADPASRARGELGTASVIEGEAIRNQMAASLAGVLELIPGIPLQAPGLDNVQQVSLRSVPISSGAVGSGRSAQNLAAFGTLIVLDGVPLSNNANLQSLGARAELQFSSAAGGGVDLRRIPATTIERVEVIRGVPSARYGDLTQGAIIVDTRAGAIDPAVAVRLDASTTEVSLVGGRQLGARQTGSVVSNLSRTATGGVRSDETSRFSAQVAHRATFGVADSGSAPTDATSAARLVFDTRADFYRLVDDRPEVATLIGNESHARDVGLRLLERVRVRLRGDSRVDWTTALERGRQQATSRRNLLRGATPITDRTEAGRQVGRYLGGFYNARVSVDGAPMFLYSRSELFAPGNLGGFSHDLVLGSEVRREVNHGDGVQFDIAFPAQSRFNGVRGFDRPRSFSTVPAVATSSFYVDDRLARPLPGGMLLTLQVGGRVDILHDGGTWLSRSRDLVAQPRINVDLAATKWLRLRAGAGRLAKAPSISDLYPALNYYDVINVNFFANEPSERLAVLTTFVFDPTNPRLAYSVADRAEAGFEVRLNEGAANLSFTAFADRTANAVGVREEATSITRDFFNLLNTTPGTGRPPSIVEPRVSFDSVPVLIDRPANNTSLRGSGFEFTADFAEIPALRTRLAFQGALVRSRLESDGVEFATSFADFQISQNQRRSPYYNGIIRTGERFLFNTRIIHQQPAVGLIITGTIQHTLREIQENIGGTDTLAFAGYITRGGSLVPVPVADRGRPEFADIRVPRRGLFIEPQRSAVDWLFSFQVSKTLPRDSRLSFYAFNAFDRTGNYGTGTVVPRLFQSNRFGLEVTIPVRSLRP